MIPAYRWVCYACGVVNDADIERCAACGFTASAKGRDIAYVRQERGLSAHPRPGPLDGFGIDPRHMTATHWAPFGVAILLGVPSAVLLNAMLSLWTFGLGAIVVLVAGLLIYLVSQKTQSRARAQPATTSTATQ